MNRFRSKESLAGLTLSAFGLAYALVGRNLELGSASHMGPGYFPRMLSILLILVGLLIFVTARKGESLSVNISWRPLIFVTLSVIVFAFAVTSLGLVISSLLLVLIASASTRSSSYRETIILAVCLSAGCVAVFVYVLGIAMPIFPTIQW